MKIKKEELLLGRIEDKMAEAKAGLSKQLDGILKAKREDVPDQIVFDRLQESTIKLKTYLSGSANNFTRNVRINLFIDNFDSLWESDTTDIILLNNKAIKKEVNGIKSDLDKLYIKGEIEILQEIKHDLIREMYLSFSRIHGSVEAVLTTEWDNEIDKAKMISSTFQSNRAKQSHIRDLIMYIDSYRYIAVLTPEKKQSKNSDTTITIEDVAVSKKAAEEIYKILIKASLIQKESKIFVDTAKGGKVFLCAILFDLLGKGYFKRRLKNDDFMAVCLNSFAVPISLGTMKGKSEFPKSAVNGLNIPVFNSI